MDYTNKLIIPFYRMHLGRSNLDLEYISKNNNLRYLESFLKKSDNIFLIHTQDDFLLEPGDAEYLDQVFQDRATIYPSGGHVTSFWYHLIDIKDILTQ